MAVDSIPIKIDELRGAVGKDLRRRRRLRGLSQAELADLVGVSHTTICRIEKGKANPTLSTLLWIFLILGGLPAEDE